MSRRRRLGRVLRPGAASLLLLLTAPLRADIGDADPALRGWVPEPARPRAAAADPLDWERRLRGAAALGPAPLTPPAQALLDAACTARADEALRLLRQHPGAAAARGADGRHALGCAAAAGRDELVAELARRGAELDRTDAEGLTPLAQAAWRGHRSTVRLLLRLGADPAAFSRNGHTALHLAAIAGQLEVVREMLARGVPIELLNRQRESALDVAAAAQQDALIDLLVQGGADLTRAGRR